MTEKIIIIGSGVAGLAAAIRMRKRGFEVEVFEANPYTGGKLTEIRLGAYRFDAGPSLFTMPELMEELFQLAGVPTKDYFEYLKLDESCRYFWEDGTRFTAYSDRKMLLTEAEEVLGEPAENLQKALDQSALLYDTLAELFMFKPIHKLSTWTGPGALQAYSRLHKLNFTRSMDAQSGRLFKTAKMRQLFNRYATYNGSDPYQAPATLHIIPHLEFNRGAFFPKEGMHSISQSLYRRATDMGVRFHLGQKVEAIVVDGHRTTGIQIQGKFVPADRVISNMDMVNTYKKLLPEEFAPSRLLNQPKSSSALIFYWGIKKDFPQLGLHNIIFSDDYKAEFDHIFKKGEIFSDPTVYINITSKHKTDDAAAGGENWFTMINVPNNSGQDWDALIPRARAFVLEKLSRVLGSDVASLIEVEDHLDPRRIEARTSSFAGALYGNSSNNAFAAFLRHPIQHKKIPNLYFVGGSVHPGGGIPLSLLSARQLDEEYILK
jgi:phytoene desaturase